MTRAIVYPSPEGAPVSVIAFPLVGETDEAAVTRIAAAQVPLGVGYTVVNSDNVPGAEHRLVDGAWVESSAAILAEAKARKLAELKARCGVVICAGFISKALGEAHLYPNSELDQANLLASVLASNIATDADWTTKTICRNGAGEWERRVHTASQIQRVGADGKEFVSAQLDILDAVRKRVAAAATTAEVAAITFN